MVSGMPYSATKPPKRGPSCWPSRTWYRQPNQAAQLGERVALADLVDRVLDGLGRPRPGRQRGQRGGKVLQRGAFRRRRARGSASPAGRSPGSRRSRGRPGGRGRAGSRRGVRVVAADEAPQDVGRVGVHHARQVEQHGEGDRAAAVVRAGGRHGCARRDWSAAPRSICAAGAIGVGDVFVHRARDHVEIQPLGPLRRVVHELRQRFGRGVAQPVVHRQAVALRLADLLRRARRGTARRSAFPAARRQGCGRSGWTAGRESIRSLPDIS